MITWIFMVIVFIASGVIWGIFHEEFMGKVLLFAGICIAAFNLLEYILPFFYYISLCISVLAVLATLAFIFVKLFIKK